MNPNSVCAVIVTYNRKELLRECLQALLEQTQPVHRILVVDNVSTDGTVEMLEADFSADRHRQITIIRLPANVGGAGGFHEGFRRAFETGSEWVWAMDDDGLPESSALERLLAADAAGLFRAPLVLAREDPAEKRLAFPGRADGGSKTLNTRTDVENASRDGLAPGYVAPFNGVLVHRSVIERVGFPRAEFFLWGDEWDYVFRARKLGITPTTVLDALFRHPESRTNFEWLKVGPFRWRVPTAPDAFRSYLLIRNYAYLAMRHRGFIHWVRHTIKYFLFHMRRPELVGPIQAFRYSTEGLRGNLRDARSFRR